MNGFPNIEPLGGKKDKGRDAINIDRSNLEEITIFAYSVREDWKNKLTEDADKIKRHSHPCKRLVFMCTASFTANQRDDTIAYIKDTFGWELWLFGLERFRIQLAANHSHLLPKHPQIFTPALFPGELVSAEATVYDRIVIDHVSADEDLASWLSRRLTLEGYKVWCRNTSPVVGESVDDTLTRLIRGNAFSFISILSPQSVESPELTSRRTIALECAGQDRSKLLVPIISKPFDDSRLDHRTSQMGKIDFSNSYKEGLCTLLEYLAEADCPKFIDAPTVNHQSLIHHPVIKDDPEILFSNCFPVITLPDHIYSFYSHTRMGRRAAGECGKKWAFSMISPNSFLAFTDPPESLRSQYDINKDIGHRWTEGRDDIKGKRPFKIVAELLRKSMTIACLNKGLLFCEKRELSYFPFDLLKSQRLYFDTPDNKKGFFTVCGKRKFWRPGGGVQYLYHLTPLFSIRYLSDGTFYVVLRILIRFTELSGELITEQRTTQSRRKHLCGDWYNEKWFARVLGIMHFLADGDAIRVGVGSQAVIVSKSPYCAEVPISIDDLLVAQLRKSCIGEELLLHDKDEEDAD